MRLNLEINHTYEILRTLHGCSLLVDGHYKFQVALCDGITVYCWLCKSKISILFINCYAFGLSHSVGVSCILILIIVKIMVSNILCFTVQMFTSYKPAVLQQLFFILMQKEHKWKPSCLFSKATQYHSVKVTSECIHSVQRMCTNHQHIMWWNRNWTLLFLS